ncbi:MAG: PAS domain S-box protein [Opitutaceae bacterium]
MSTASSPRSANAAGADLMWAAAIVEYSDDAIVSTDLGSVISSWNKGAERTFGYTAAEMVGTSIMRLIPGELKDEEPEIFGRIKRSEKMERFDTRWLTKDGRLIDVSVTFSPVRDAAGNVVGVSRIARDITVLKEREREIARLSRLYSALSQINQAIVMTSTRDELLGKVCRVLIEHGGFHMAWVGWEDPLTHQLVPVAVWGDDNDYIKNIKVYSDDRPEGRGPTGTAFREDRPYVCNDMLGDPVTLPWRGEIERRGFRSSAVFPIRLQGTVCGALSVYADSPGFFQDKEIALLTEASGDISFGLENFVREDGRRQAELKMRQERDFSDAMLNSLPGVLYLYDQQGRFLRWNDTFEQITGRTATEIATMHPLEFFAGDDREEVAARINEVFEKGESSVEAGFVTKDGRVIPYYFTGIRTRFADRTCLVGVGIDISDRKQAEEARLASEARYHTLFDHAPDGIVIADARSTYLDANASMCRMLGYPRGELIGLNAADIVVPEEAPHIETAIGAIQARAAYHREWRFRRKDGSVFPAEVIATLMPDGNLMGMIRDITERRQAEQALRESEAKLRALFEQAPMGIAVIDSTNGRFLKINPQYCKIVGYSEPEMLGLTFAQITHPDDIETDLSNMRRLREGDLPAFQIEKRYIRKDGSPVWVGLTCVPLWHESGTGRQHIAMVEDITARKQAEILLAESELKYRELVELANSIILRWNAAGEITFLNEYGLRFFGYSSAEVTGRHVVGTIVPETETSGRDLNRLMDQICAAPETFEKNVNENMRRGGERVWIAWTNRILRDAEGRVVEILSIGTDITKQRQAETALRELNETLEHRVVERTAEMRAAVKRAEAADRIKSAFLATMSHELRTPLNSIIGFTGIVLQGLAGPLNEEQAKQLGMVRGSARHLLELINDVLDISKIEADQLAVVAEPFDLPASLARVMASVRPLAEKKELELVAVFSAGLGVMTGDRRRVEQILLNLLNNAIKFTDRGRVTFTAEPVAAHRFSPDAGPVAAVRLSVKDSGIGIKPADLATLFQPFRQIDTGLSRQHEGTGLGLAICRRLATLMGGDIVAVSEWSHGSEFTVVLPLQPRATP